MNIGELDSKIKVYRLEDRENELGEVQPTPIYFKTVWAKIEPRTGSLLAGREAGTILSKTTHVITVRNEEVKDLTVDCFFVWNDAVEKEHRFDIDYILPPIRARQFTTIYAEENI